MNGLAARSRLAALRLMAPALAACARGVRPPGTMPPDTWPPGRPRILLIRPDHLGDALLAAPAADLLREALPCASVAWLVGPWAAEVIRRADPAGAVQTLAFPGFTRAPKRSPAEPYLILAREAARLRAARYDAALILRPDHWWGALLAAAAGIPHRFGFGVAECAPFLTDQLPPPRGHVVEASQALARLAAERLDGRSPALTPRPDALTPRPDALTPRPAARREYRLRRHPLPCAGEGEPVRMDGVSTHDDVTGRSMRGPRFVVTADEATWAARWIGDALGGGDDDGRGPLIVVHPGSGAAVKNWLPARWAAAIAALRAHHDARIVLTGGPAESELVAEIAGRVEPPPPVLVGETTLGQLGALFAHADLVVGGDSGPLHLAAAVGARTVRLYGPTDVAEFGPWPPSADHAVLTASLPCQPCRSFAPPCGAVERPACLRAIDVEAVVGAAAARLDARPVAARHEPPTAPSAGATPGTTSLDARPTAMIPGAAGAAMPQAARTAACGDADAATPRPEAPAPASRLPDPRLAVPPPRPPDARLAVPPPADTRG